MSFSRLAVRGLGLLVFIPAVAFAQPVAPPAEPVPPTPAGAPAVSPSPAEAAPASPPPADVPGSSASPPETPPVEPPPSAVPAASPRRAAVPPPPAPSAWRFGILPSIGAGAAVLTNPGVFPGFIGYTDLGVEAIGEVLPWGGFLRGDLYSSGPDGRWTGIGFAAGASKRLFGEPTALTLLARGGLAFERWHASSAGCTVTLFFPQGCKDFSLPAQTGAPITATPSTVYDGDAIGLLAGLRLELPIRPLYIALDLSFVPIVAVDAPEPGAMFQLRLNLEVGVRDTRGISASAGVAPPEDPGARQHFR